VAKWHYAGKALAGHPSLIALSLALLAMTAIQPDVLSF
jgi:hypothetical protein